MKVYKSVNIENQMIHEDSIELLQDVDYVDTVEEQKQTNQTVTPRFTDREVRFSQELDEIL